MSPRTGRCALVTGASRGLGAAFAEACARRGWDLLLADLPGTGLPELARGLEASHGISVRTAEGDLGQAECRKGLLGLASDPAYPLGLLVNNMGFSRHGYFDLMSPEVPRRIVETNVLATMEVTRDIIPVLALSKDSRILTVSSLSALRPMPLVAVYAASKAFLLDFGLALRFELAGLGIGSSVLCPGGILTNEDVRRRIAAQGLGGRLSALEPEVVAEAGISGAFRGKAIIVPGAFNKSLRILSSIRPRLPYSASVYRRWKKALGSSASSVDYEFFSRR